MVNAGKDIDGSQFSIAFVKADLFHQKYVIFGGVVKKLD